jgi:hypothetical protein
MRSWFHGLEKHGAAVYLRSIATDNDRNFTHVLSPSSPGHVFQRPDSLPNLILPHRDSRLPPSNHRIEAANERIAGVELVQSVLTTAQIEL